MPNSAARPSYTFPFLVLGFGFLLIIAIVVLIFLSKQDPPFTFANIPIPTQGRLAQIQTIQQSTTEPPVITICVASQDIRVVGVAASLDLHNRPQILDQRAIQAHSVSWTQLLPGQIIGVLQPTMLNEGTMQANEITILADGILPTSPGCINVSIALKAVGNDK